MRIDKLFKVLVVGGSVLTAGCGGGGGTGTTSGPGVVAVADVPDAATAQADVPAAVDASARADGVSSWMSWFVDLPEEDAGPADVGVADAGPADVGVADAGPADVSDDGGVFAWLSWV
jgi:uncharacterized protein YcbX